MMLQEAQCRAKIWLAFVTLTATDLSYSSLTTYLYFVKCIIFQPLNKYIYITVSNEKLHLTSQK